MSRDACRRRLNRCHRSPWPCFSARLGVLSSAGAACAQAASADRWRVMHAAVALAAATLSALAGCTMRHNRPSGGAGDDRTSTCASDHQTLGHLVNGSIIELALCARLCGSATHQVALAQSWQATKPVMASGECSSCLRTGITPFPPHRLSHHRLGPPWYYRRALAWQQHTTAPPLL